MGKGKQGNNGINTSGLHALFSGMMTVILGVLSYYYPVAVLFLIAYEVGCFLLKVIKGDSLIARILVGWGTIAVISACGFLLLTQYVFLKGLVFSFDLNRMSVVIITVMCSIVIVTILYKRIGLKEIIIIVILTIGLYGQLCTINHVFFSNIDKKENFFIVETFHYQSIFPWWRVEMKSPEGIVVSGMVSERTFEQIKKGDTVSIVVEEGLLNEEFIYSIDRQIIKQMEDLKG